MGYSPRTEKRFDMNDKQAKNFCACLLGVLFMLLVVIGAGCDRELIQVRDYASTNSPPSRYKVMSCDYYRTDSVVPTFTIFTFTDTEGTNDYMIVSTEHGLSTPIVVPKPIKVVEDWKAK
jgi:hypothetical protein